VASRRPIVVTYITKSDLDLIIILFPMPNLRVRPRKYRLSDVEGVTNTPKLGEHTNIEVIVDVVLRVVVMLRFIGR
jgi:hypothetical protein